jgi:hypothetical protein
MKPGEKFLVGIEQLTSSGAPEKYIRVSSYSNHIGKDFQMSLLTEIKEIWRLILGVHSGEVPFFDGLSLLESKERCKALDDYYLAFKDSETNQSEKWFAESCREEK